MKKSLVIATIGSMLMIMIATLLLSWTVFDLLAKETSTSAGGWPYAVCFFVAGTAGAILVGYVTYLVRTKQSLLYFAQAVKYALIVCLGAALICTVWFVMLTELFNFVGVMGLLFSASVACWGVLLCNAIQHRTVRKQSKDVALV